MVKDGASSAEHSLRIPPYISSGPRALLSTVLNSNLPSTKSKTISDRFECKKKFICGRLVHFLGLRNLNEKNVLKRFEFPTEEYSILFSYLDLNW